MQLGGNGTMRCRACQPYTLFSFRPSIYLSTSDSSQKFFLPPCLTGFRGRVSSCSRFLMVFGFKPILSESWLMSINLVPILPPWAIKRLKMVCYLNNSLRVLVFNGGANAVNLLKLMGKLGIKKTSCVISAILFYVLTP
jgi:hypothetical protein